tara:strand:- start:52 stop:336 length:285 start_codon:yes stop_codon:yes gene_type:complete
MLTERTEIDKYEIVGDFKHIQCRHATIIERDGLEISRSYHRHVIAPSDDVTGEPQEVQALVALMHTPAVIAAYEAHVAAQLPEPTPAPDAALEV